MPARSLLGDVCHSAVGRIGVWREDTKHTVRSRAILRTWEPRDEPGSASCRPGRSERPKRQGHATDIGGMVVAAAAASCPQRAKKSVCTWCRLPKRNASQAGDWPTVCTGRGGVCRASELLPCANAKTKINKTDFVSATLGLGSRELSNANLIYSHQLARLTALRPSGSLCCYLAPKRHAALATLHRCTTTNRVG